jgi:hypothetical protein
VPGRWTSDAGYPRVREVCGISAFELRTPDDASQGTYTELRAFLEERGGSEEYRSSDPGIRSASREA